MNNQIKLFINLTLIGIGTGVLSGSILKIAIPAYSYYSVNSLNSRPKKKEWDRSYTILIEQKNIKELNSNWQFISSKYKDLKASGYLYLVDKQEYAELNSNDELPAASSIKIPILIVALNFLDQGKLQWDEEVVLNKEDIGGGAGWMAYQQIGQSFPIYEIATEMIRVSDNTATNLLIKRLGGIKEINQKFLSMGLNSTRLNNILPDLDGSNLTTAKDLVTAISLADSKDYLSQRSRDIYRDIMSTSKTNRLLPGGLLRGLNKRDKTLNDIDYKLLIKGFKVHNKTGDIGTTYVDAGLIQMPNTTKAIASFIVKGPFNDPRSPELIREMSAAIVPFIHQKPSQIQVN